MTKEIKTQLDRIEAGVKLRNGVILRLDGHHLTLYGEDGRGGIVQEITELAATAKASLFWTRVGAGLLIMALGTILAHSLVG